MDVKDKRERELHRQLYWMLRIRERENYIMSRMWRKQIERNYRFERNFLAKKLNKGFQDRMSKGISGRLEVDRNFCPPVQVVSCHRVCHHTKPRNGSTRLVLANLIHIYSMFDSK